MEAVAVGDRFLDWDRVARAAVEQVVPLEVLHLREDRHRAGGDRRRKRRRDFVLFKPDGLPVGTVHRAGQKARFLRVVGIPVKPDVLLGNRLENVVEAEHRALAQQIAPAHVFGVAHVMLDDLARAHRLARYIRKRVRGAGRNADDIRKEHVLFEKGLHHACAVVAPQAAAFEDERRARREDILQFSAGDRRLCKRHYKCLLFGFPKAYRTSPAKSSGTRRGFPFSVRPSPAPRSGLRWK